MICKNGTPHQHETVYQSKVCWGVIARPVPAPVIRPVIAPATASQISYVGILKGDQDYAAGLGKLKCSEYIDSLKRKKPAVTVTAPTRSPKSKFIIDNLLGDLPNGYFAVQKEDGANITFLRVSRPKHGNYKDAVKVQTIHGPNMADAWVYHQNRDRLFIKHGAAPAIEENIMLVFTDWQAAAMRYARLIGKCARCNLRLTDDRSRHYGIGPICDKVWTSYIERVDEQEGGSFEHLRSIGKA